MQEAAVLYDAFRDFALKPLNWVMAGSLFIVFSVLRAMVLGAAGFSSIQAALYFSLVAGILSFTGAGVLLWYSVPIHPLWIHSAGAILGAMWTFEAVVLILWSPRRRWIDGLLGNTLAYLVLATAGLCVYILTSFPLDLI